jgi:putative phage-type endonuclease
VEAEVLEKRRKGVGGSDVAPICGLSPWKSAYQVWQEKLNLAEKFEATPEMKYGLLVEPTIRQWYSDETGRVVHVPKNMLSHPKYPFMVANLDGYTDDNRVVEIKTARSSLDWGEPGTDEIPIYYQTQVQHYMIVTGFEVCDVPVSFAGSMPVIYEVPADKELQEMIIEKEAEFWRFVEKEIPPEPVTYSDMIARFRKSAAIEMVADKDALEYVEVLRCLKEYKDNIEAQEKEAKAYIMKFLGGADTLIDDAGRKLVTWKQAKPAKRFDAKAFQAVHIDLYNQFIKEGEASRRFVVNDIIQKRG